MANNSETIGILMEIINRHKHLLELSKYEESILSEIINPNFSLIVNIDCPNVWCEFSHDLEKTIPNIGEISYIKNLNISVSNSPVRKRYN
jgi:lipid A disaccharide synthetase